MRDLKNYHMLCGNANTMWCAEISTHDVEGEKFAGVSKT
jgi:hypothetical protein